MTMAQNNYKNEGMPHEAKMVLFGIIAVICGIIFLIFLFGSWYTVEAGQRVILLTFRNPSSNIQGPGLHFKIPLVQSIVRMDVKTQTIQFDNAQGTGDNSEYSSLFAASQDLQDVQIATIVNYHISENDVLEIYQQHKQENGDFIKFLDEIIDLVKKTDFK